jgi:uncharacterized membrane protein YdjX (TVP38/TMEM64 family)
MVGEYWNSFKKWYEHRKNRKKILVPLALITVLFILSRIMEVDEYLKILQDWLWSLGPWGPVAFIGLYVGATLLLMPGTPFTIAAAFLFGTSQAYFIMVAASSLAAAVGFLVGRFGARDAILKVYSGTRNFSRLKEMVEKNHRIAILFVRLMPFFPFAINNYALGLTRISFWSYLFYSELVFLPMNAVLVYGAYAIYRTMVGGGSPWLFIGITAAGGFLVLGLGYLCKRVFGAQRSA